ncbi:hypothetical protein HDV00_012655, partial [Rhizophlyctis rosea]
MVLENTDDVMVEARTLLNQWIDQAPTTASSLSSDASDRLRKTLNLDSLLPPEERQALQRTKDHIKSIVVEAMNEVESHKRPTKPKPTTQDPRITMQARQNLARERRESLEKKRVMERETKAREKEARVAFEVGRKETQRKVMEKWMMDVAIRSAKDEMEKRMKEKAGTKVQEEDKDDHASARSVGGLVGEGKAEEGRIVQDSAKLKRDSEEEKESTPAESQKAEEDESVRRAREGRAAKAEELFMMHQMKFLK